MYKEPNFYNFDEILVIGKQICDSTGFTPFEANPNDIFFYHLYKWKHRNSKGVMLSHKNIVSQLHDINKLIDLPQSEVALSLLPLAHIFERTVMSYYLSRGISIYFVDDILNVANLMKVVKPTIMTVVPRLLEKIFNKNKSSNFRKTFFSKVIASLAFSYALKET